MLLYAWTACLFWLKMACSTVYPNNRMRLLSRWINERTFGSGRTQPTKQEHATYIHAYRQNKINIKRYRLVRLNSSSSRREKKKYARMQSKPTPAATPTQHKVRCSHALKSDDCLICIVHIPHPCFHRCSSHGRLIIFILQCLTDSLADSPARKPDELTRTGQV